MVPDAPIVARVTVAELGAKRIGHVWMLEEMGEPYQLIEKSTRADDLQSSEYLRLNPNARIPTLVDGDLERDEFCLNRFRIPKSGGF